MKNKKNKIALCKISFYLLLTGGQLFTTIIFLKLCSNKNTINKNFIFYTIIFYTIIFLLIDIHDLIIDKKRKQNKTK